MRDDRIVWVGAAPDTAELITPGTVVVDCAGGAVIPGFHDAHMHLLAYAASLDAVDCSPHLVSSIADITRAIQDRVQHIAPGQWIVASGYDQARLTERRHPTRLDLDEVSPDHPVRLNHGSGHACVLNSRAMELVGIGDDTEEPAGATIDRFFESGSPSGLLFEMEEFLECRVMGRPPARIAASAQRATQRLLSMGVTSIQDATHHNSIDRWELFVGLADQEVRLPRITLMPGHSNVAEFVEHGLGFGAGDNRLRVGHAKLMATASSGGPVPPSADIREAVEAAVSLGFPIAVHAVEAEVVRAAVEAISGSAALPNGVPPHRIEHCSECPPDILEMLAHSGAAVVTQPGFIHHRGDRYMDEVAPRMHPYLYRAASLVDRGVRTAFSSDAPVIDPNPMTTLHAAITRRTDSGQQLGEHESMTLAPALQACTTGPALLSGSQNILGSITPNYLADLVLFDEDITRLEPDALLETRPVKTMLGGQIVWER